MTVDRPARWMWRWHLSGGGVENVWHYTRELLPCPSGRLLLRGPNGTGKTTLLEGLCPYLLNPRAQALSSGRNRSTSLESLMKGGSSGRRRNGYLWLTFSAPEALPDAGSDEVHYGVRLEYAQGCSPAVEVVPFWTPVLPGDGREDLSELSREEFTAVITGDGGQVFKDGDDYVAHLAQTVFGTTASTLKQLAKRIRKIRNPGLLAGLNPREAENELRQVLPTVDADVLRVCEEALAATEDTRLRYARAEKTTGLVMDLASAWTQECARRLRLASETARKEVKNLQEARADASAAQEEAQATEDGRARLTDELSAQVAAERVARSRAETLARDAASSDVTRAREKAEATRSRFDADCDVLRMSGQVARERTAAHLALASSAMAQVEEIERECGEGGVSVSLHVPVTVTRQDPSRALRIGKVDFEPVPTVTVCTHTVGVDQSVESLSAGAERSRRRSADAHVLLHAYKDVAARETAARAAREAAVDAARLAEAATARCATHTDKVHQCVAVLSSGVESWARSCTSGPRTPRLDLAEIASTAQDWRQAAETASVVHEVAGLARRISSMAADAAGRARTRAGHHRKQATLARKQAQEDEQRAQAWRSGRLLPFPRPSWSASPSGEERAFAAAVEWDEAACPAGWNRDVLEAVLEAAGLLGATLTPAGVESEDGWQVRAQGPLLPPQQSLASVLTALAGHPLESTATQVLQRIALLDSAVGGDGDTAATLVIGADGTHRCGPLLGRLSQAAVSRPPAASHIGLEARRAAVLREAAAAQADCDRQRRAAARHEQAARALADFERESGRLSGAFPQQLMEDTTCAEALRADSASAAAAARTDAALADRKALEQESAHRTALDRWRGQAVSYELPDEKSLVEEEAETARRSQQAMSRAAERMRTVRAALSAIEAAAQKVAEALDIVRTSRSAVEGSHSDLLAANTALEVCRQRCSLDEVDLEQKAEKAKLELQQLSEQLAACREEYTKAVEAAVRARSR
ncbi:hypothetical protein ACFWAX_30795, partial [Streptomyces sp. NPDC059956]